MSRSPRPPGSPPPGSPPLSEALHAGASGTVPSKPGEPSDARASTQAATSQLVDMLERGFRAAIRRSLGVELELASESLAFVDHYLRQAAKETRREILTLVAAQAGAFYGELVRTSMGGFWLSDGSDPRSLRLFLRPAQVRFAPLDQAYEAITGGPLEDDDPRCPDGLPIDAAFHIGPVPSRAAPSPVVDPDTDPTTSASDTDASDASWLHARLLELPPLREDLFHSLTGRFETLELILELLATRHEAQGRTPREYALADYLEG